MQPGEIAIGIAALYLFVTLVFQLKPLSSRFLTLDLMGVIPRWLFFTHGVGSFTLLVRVRTRSPSGQFSDWRSVSLWPQRRWWHWIYFPEQFQSGILWNALYRLARRAENQMSTEGTQAYDTMVHYLMKTEPAAEPLQFAVLRLEGSKAAEDARILFTSDLLSK